MNRSYEIGPFRLDCDAGVLTEAGVPVALGSRAVAVLTSLVKRANEYVSKDNIMDEAWRDVVVEESNLAVQISAIRRVLSHAPGGERWIETLSRRGYRFVGPVSEFTDDRHPNARGGTKNTNLPEPLTSFIGRERELVEIKRLLSAGRWLTLVGPGGIGKTRLALQAAAEVADAYRDGVWLVELGSIRDPSLVPTSVAQALGIQERTDAPITDRLCANLKSRQLLLILDNCEHLLDACARLADAIVRAAPEPAIIATSREPLRVLGEQIYPLQTLSLPDPSASAATMARSEAVQLFVERARQQLPDFELTEARAPAIAQLCIHLDGIPLALELAAARVRSLSIEQINARLHERFRLLTSGSRTAIPRQQTLRATLDWSFDLLKEQERVVLRRLAIFAGGFTLEAASTVASDAGIDEFAAIDLLSQLVERSLIVADTDGVGARYRLLETTRTYALEKLDQAEETDAIKRRHAQYFRGLFESASDDFLRMSDADWYAVYPPELDNVRAALDWAFDAAGDPAIAVALAGASGLVWQSLSLLGEGAQRVVAAVARVEANTPELEEARLCLSLGLLYVGGAGAVASLRRAADLYRRSGDVPWLGWSLVQIGHKLTVAGRFEEALLVLTEARAVVERAGLPKVFAVYFRTLGLLKLLTRDLTSARTHFENALSRYKGIGADSAALAVLVALADVTWTLGDLSAALAALLETVPRLRNCPGTRRSLGVCLINIAGVYTERGQIDRALAAAREGLPLMQDAGYAWATLDYLALRAALSDKLANAARIAGYADSAHAANVVERQPNEARARKRLEALLREKLAPGELERLLAEGAKMSEDEACRKALEE